MCLGALHSSPLHPSLSPVQPPSVATTALFQLVQQQRTLPSTPSSSDSSAKVNRPSGRRWCVAPCQGCTASRIAVCTLHSPGTCLIWDLQRSCLGVFLPMLSTCLQPPKLQALPAVWAAIKNRQLSVFTSMGCCLPDDVSALLLPRL